MEWLIMLAGVGGSVVILLLFRVWDVLFPHRIQRVVAWVIHHWPPYRKRLTKIGAPETHPYVTLPIEAPKYRIVPDDEYEGYTDED